MIGDVVPCKQLSNLLVNLVVASLHSLTPDFGGPSGYPLRYRDFCRHRSTLADSSLIIIINVLILFVLSNDQGEVLDSYCLVVGEEFAAYAKVGVNLK